MEALKGEPLATSPIASARWVRDLVAHDGPLISEWRNASHEPLLFVWCDCDEYHNRWLVARLTEVALLSYARGRTTLRSVLLGPADGFLFVTDLDEAGASVATRLVTPGELPVRYLPSQDSRLPTAFVRRDADDVLLLDGSWTADDLSELLTEYQKLYLFVWHFGRRDAELAGPSETRTPANSYPWRGGYSSKHFFENLRKLTPSAARPRMAAVAYASPGYVRWQGAPLATAAVRDAVGSYLREASAIDEVVRDVKDFIRRTKLNVPGTTMRREEEGWLSHMFATLMRLMPWIRPEALVESSGDVFARVKTVLAVHLRLERIALLVTDQKVFL